ncbi:MAG: tetratricopeptide repeat protein [Chloroflexota bacterium]
MEQVFTFLFTDIEGSTRLWEQQPQVMSQLLAEHNQILDQAVKSHHGKVFKTVGDGFCAVFELASDALSAALHAQRRLLNPQNGQPIALKVRMGLHSGSAEEREGDYFGPTLNRVARLMGAASGGQTLISAATKERLEDTLPYDIELRDLGQHRLRDLKDAEHIFQVVVPDLRSSFPPIKSLSPRATNLPAHLTSFVGREHDVDEICRLSRQSHVRLLTLLGPGGVGKTRLSIQVGSNLQDEYEDGVFFVALAPVSHPEGVIEVIAQALKVEESGETFLLDRVKSHLRDRHLLLVLDNFEQVIDASPLVNELLAAAQHLKVVTTSREELMIYGEHIYTVAALTLPEATRTLDIPTLMQFSAVMLFVERVQATRSDFTMDLGNAPYIVEICQRLDGLPLAIELAAVRIRDLSVEAIAEQLSRRLHVLSKGPRDFPSRQRTMRGAIEWSYDMLPAEEQQAFARLGVFVGPFTAEAADTVAGAQSLNRLREKSLIHQIQEQEQVLTFLMLETLREYALEQLISRSELAILQRQHADYYIQLTETAEPQLTGANQIEWFNRLEIEKYNVQTALEWLFSQGDMAGAGRMAAVLWRYWGAHSRLSAGSQWIEQILAHPEALSTHVRAKVAHGAGRLASLQYHYPQAKEYLKTSLSFYEQSDDPLGQAAVYLSLGEIELRQANYLAAEGYFQHGLVFYVELDDQAGFARCLAQLGRLAVREGNLASAEGLFQQSLELIRQFGSTESIAIVMNDLAEVLRAQGKYHEAAELYHESLVLYRQLDFDIGVAVISHNLGQVARQLGNYEEAFVFFQQALRLLQDMEEKQIIVECLAGIGGVFLHTGEVARAVRFLSAANALMETLQLQLDYADQTDYERNMDNARQQLDTATWAVLWSEGQTIRLEQVFAEALRSANPSKAKENR